MNTFEVSSWQPAPSFTIKALKAKLDLTRNPEIRSSTTITHGSGSSIPA